MTNRLHYYKYTPILIGGQKRYRVALPIEASPVAYKTLTTNMRCWHGQLVKSRSDRATALVWSNSKLTTIEGKLINNIVAGHPCYIMEHLNINGEIDLMIGNENILNGDQNFINFGIPNGKHVRIDIYTGESKVIE